MNLFTNKRKNILNILFIIGILLHFFGLLRIIFNNYKINIDILSYNKDKSLLFNGWTLSHLLLYIYIGYKYPDEYLFIFIIGLLWELYEFSYDYIDFFKNIVFKLLKTNKLYILGNPYDPLVNIIGYFIGSQILKHT